MNTHHVMRRSLGLFVLSGACALALAVGTGACRKPPPQEVVFTGAGPKTSAVAPPPPPAPTVEPPAPVEAFTKAGLLKATADCALSRYKAFEVLARAQRDAAQTYAKDRTPPNATAAQNAWLAAMGAWQEAEIFRVGPAAHSAQPGGKDLRDQIYAWPLVSRCKIEEQLVSQAYAQPDFSASLVNGRGLSAIEYLAFYAGTDNVCSQFSVINNQGSWAALGAGELANRKASYAAATAEDVLARATQLVGAWDPASGNFHRELATAGSGSKVFATDQDALNAITVALFYIDVEVKDLKLGRPAGLFECADKTCPEAIEATFAHASTKNLQANLSGFRRIFQGCGDDGSGIGFDDYLRAVGAADLATRMLSVLAGAQAAVNGLNAPVEQVLAADPMRILATHAAVKVLTDELKTEFVTVLNLELPKATEGDND